MNSMAQNDSALESPISNDWSSMKDHIVQFYERDNFLLQSLSQFISTSLANESSCLIVSTPEHHERLSEMLRNQNVDLSRAIASESYQFLDASETLSSFLIDGSPDADLFRMIIEPLLKNALQKNGRVVVFGEMVALLWSENKYDEAMKLEQYWNDLKKDIPFTLYCGYPIEGFGGENLAPLLSDVCSTHSVIVPTESYSGLIQVDDRMKLIVELQQKAKSLELMKNQLENQVQELARLNHQVQQQLKERDQLLVREHSAKLQAQNANRMKDEFLATISHELRTPLTSLFGWTRLLRSGNLKEATFNRALDVIERSAHAQKQLVEDLLDISRISAGKIQMDSLPLDIVSVVQEAIDAVRPSANTKNILIQLEIQSSPREFQGDPGRLQQVLSNLLSNAIKFTPARGRVDIILKCTDSEMQIIVKDNGQGIHPDFLPFIFDRFCQEDSSMTRRHGGLGLGLAIVRHIVELHDGTIHAESPGKDQGSTFTVRLPMQPELKNQDQQDSLNLDEINLPSIIRDSLAGLRVLFIETDFDTREFVTMLMNDWKMEVRFAECMEEAIGIFLQWSPHLLFSDFALAEKEECGLIRKIRSLGSEEGGWVPAIVTAEYPTAEDKIRTLSEGFNLCISKPIEPLELASSIFSVMALIKAHH
jgi:signal transduction histidine kinase